MTEKWTDEEGIFALGTDRWDYGAWRKGGFGYHRTSEISVHVRRCSDESCTVYTSACTDLTPEQARQLARVLVAAADKAESESIHGK